MKKAERKKKPGISATSEAFKERPGTETLTTKDSENTHLFIMFVLYKTLGSIVMVSPDGGYTIQGKIILDLDLEVLGVQSMLLP